MAQGHYARCREVREGPPEDGGRPRRNQTISHAGDSEAARHVRLAEAEAGNKTASAYIECGEARQSPPCDVEEWGVEMKKLTRPNLWATDVGRREYMNRRYAARKVHDPEGHKALIKRTVDYTRRKKYGIIGCPEELPTDRCAFPDCKVKREVGTRGLHADRSEENS